MTHYIAVKVKPNGEYCHFEVAEEVYIYIRQLENAVRYRFVRRNLKRLYPERFRKGYSDTQVPHCDTKP